MNVIRLCLLAACSASVVPASSFAGQGDPSDVTRSSYATPVRGDVIEWDTERDPDIQTVTFEEGSAVLGASARAALAAAVAHQGPGGRAEITGRIGPTERPALAAARGIALRRALMSEGMPSSRITILPTSRQVESKSPKAWVSTVRLLNSRDSNSLRHLDATVTASTNPMPAPLAASSALNDDLPAARPAPTMWEVQPQDITLAKTLERWATSAGYKLRWDADRNFLVAATDRYEGTFESAVQAVLGSAGIRQSDYPLEACIYANRPPLVRITRLGEQARECEAP